MYFFIYLSIYILMTLLYYIIYCLIQCYLPVILYIILSITNYIQANERMFYQSTKTRIKTQPKTSNEYDDNLLENKAKLKIKNIRFSLQQQINKISNQMILHDENEDNKISIQNDTNNKIKRINYFNKLPGLIDKQIDRQIDKQVYRPYMPKYIKKQTFLRSIMEKMKPYKHQGLMNKQIKQESMLRQHKKWKDWKVQTNSYQFINEFSEENMKVGTLKSSKHYRPPKIIQNQMIKFKNNNNVIRRKIFSEDKNRQQIEKQCLQPLKNQADLDRIQIITFSNKFPGIWKE